MLQLKAVSLPHWIVTFSGWCAIFATAVIALSIIMHLLNYRKPFQQRLMIRIQLILPVFALSCYLMLVNPRGAVVKYLIEPIREIYEAFVIYTFFSLLIDMLGGAKSIIIMTSGRTPVQHPGVIRFCLPPLDISDPRTFLAIKRGILQYVWLKPILCFSVLFFEGIGQYDVNDMGPKSIYLWITIVYNLSVSLSLYCLAMFWKILWTDLRPFNPIAKFLCVKLIIFASYWQGVLLAILNFAGVLPGNNSLDDNAAPNLGVSIQNALLCVELVAFAVGHWFAFSYKPFTISLIPNGRLQFYYAVRDMIGIKDLIIDFELTFYGDYYKDYKQFNSVDAIIAHPSSKGTMSRINQGLRYHTDGKQKHWLAQQHGGAQGLPANASVASNRQSIISTSEINAIPNLGVKGSGLSQYAASINLAGASTKGLYPGKSPSVHAPDSKSINTVLSALDDDGDGIETAVKSLNPEIDYDQEGFEEDEHFYAAACSVVNNYNLDQTEVKKLINYPIVDDVIMGHEYGYKVKKLRANRQRLQKSNVLKDSNRYGSV